MKKNMLNWALVVGCHGIGYGVIRSLGERQVPLLAAYYSDHDMGYVSKYVKHAYKISDPDKQSKTFVADLIKISRDFSGCVLFPSDDPSLWEISKSKDLLSNYFLVACPDFQSINRIIDKKYTYECVSKFGVPIPKTFSVASSGELDAIRDMLHYPCILKPRKSHLFFEQYRRKAILVHTYDDLILNFNRYNKSGHSFLIQEFIPGPDTNNVNYNSLNYNNHPIAEFTSRKERLSQPGFGIPRCVRSQRITKIDTLGRLVIKAVGFKGYSCVEFKYDMRDETWKLLEINGRHNRSGLLSLKCGINFPFLEYSHLTNGSYDAAEKFTENVFWIDEFHDFFSTFKYFKIESYSLREYVKPYFGTKIFAILNFTDPKPFVLRMTKLLKAIFKKCSFSPFRWKKIGMMFNKDTKEGR